MNEHNTFKEEVCSHCPNFFTVPMCFKCRTYTGDEYSPDFSIKGEKNPNYEKMVYSIQLASENGAFVV